MQAAEEHNPIVDEKLLKTLYILYRTNTHTLTRSEMTRHMTAKKLGTLAQREALIEEARKQKLLNVGRNIQLGKGGQNPITYQLTKLGVDTVAPFVGDDDLEDHEK